MLAQYLTTESMNMFYYLSNLVGGNINNHELLQDALAIIRLNNNQEKNKINDIVGDWSAKLLPSPFTTSYTYTITELRLLFARMSEFIDDYLSKATAQRPAEAFLNPPSNTYIDTVNPRCITLDDLNPHERLRLFGAFIKFELYCHLNNPRTVKATMTEGRWSDYIPRERQLTPREQEELVCVYEYMKASYAAVFSQCAGFRSSAGYKITCNRLRRLRVETPILVESLYFDHRFPFLQTKFQGFSRERPEKLPWFGFNFLSHMIKEAKKADQESGLTPAWIMTMGWKYDDLGYTYWAQPFVGGKSVSEISAETETGLWASLLARDSNDTSDDTSEVGKTQLSIYRQRAWVFFDDDRLFADREAHFPTRKYIELECQRLENERKMETRKEWQDYFAGRRPKPPSYAVPPERHTLPPHSVDLGKVVVPPFFVSAASLATQS
ncbi:hypothetical protein IL306_012172 [Fusarium sp. DS 682]|nr:hypothetical protein IL306_012172 [Fusarium sp. DS 682]